MSGPYVQVAEPPPPPAPPAEAEAEEVVEELEVRYRLVSAHPSVIMRKHGHVAMGIHPWVYSHGHTAMGIQPCDCSDLYTDTTCQDFRPQSLRRSTNAAMCAAMCADMLVHMRMHMCADMPVDMCTVLIVTCLTSGELSIANTHRRIHATAIAASVPLPSPHPCADFFYVVLAVGVSDDDAARTLATSMRTHACAHAHREIHAVSLRKQLLCVYLQQVLELRVAKTNGIKTIGGARGRGRGGCV